MPVPYLRAHHAESFIIDVLVRLSLQASRHEEAERLFRQAQIIAPYDPAVYMQSGTQ